MIRAMASFIGWSNTGKTTFIEACAREASAMGLRPAALKQVRHPGAYNPDGKDSTRFFSAGADSALLSANELVLTRKPPAALDASFLASLFPDADLVFLEGAEPDGSTLVLVAGPARLESECKRPFPGFDAIVSDDAALGEEARRAGLRVYGSGGAARFLDDMLSGVFRREVRA